jgi:hypothetical protein
LAANTTAIAAQINLLALTATIGWISQIASTMDRALWLSQVS